MSSSAISAYAKLCFIANRKPDASEFLAMMYFGINPEWMEDL